MGPGGGRIRFQDNDFTQVQVDDDIPGIESTPRNMIVTFAAGTHSAHQGDYQDGKTATTVILERNLLPWGPVTIPIPITARW